MRVLYLDQNHWIALAKAVKTPDQYPAAYGQLERLVEEVKAGRLVTPLSATNLYETYKIGDPLRRGELAYVQATLSGGWVFRGRAARLEAEVGDVLRDAKNLPVEMRPARWFLSNLFPEAFADLGDTRTTLTLSEALRAAMQREPAGFLFDYLTQTADADRLVAVAAFSAGSDDLRRSVEARRALVKDEALAMRQRVYGARLIVDEIDQLVAIAQSVGLEVSQITDLGGSLIRRLVRDVPLYNIERELVVRLESQDRAVHENDFRDMQAYCAAIRYADVVVGENQFVNLAIQGRLDKTYSTRVTSDLLEAC